tara:strand:+ start:334 stop:798 length:465 start_codon:yes stop_codon:yes gene_type:complete
MYKVQPFNKQKSAEILSQLRDYSKNLCSCFNLNSTICKKYLNRFTRLQKIINELSFSENSLDNNSTSYTINKSELVLCLRSKKTKEYHDLNIIKYILTHELAHIICPEIGHTDLFYNINKYLLQLVKDNKLFDIINFKNNPTEYCGIELNEYLL